MAVRFLHTNDLHGALDDAGESILAARRPEVEFLFDTGDAIRAGNLAVPLRPEAVWPRFARLNLTAATLGNRETHVIPAGFEAKLAGAAHPILVSNLTRKDGSRPYLDHLILEANGTRVGVFGVMVPMVTERMRTKAASAFLWTPPLDEADRVVAELRPQVDLLIALTHIGHRLDLELALRRPEIDVVLGGHSHTVLETPSAIGQTYVCQGGSHARFYGEYVWDGGHLEGRLHRLRTADRA